jgi:hypothetical protein
MLAIRNNRLEHLKINCLGENKPRYYLDQRSKFAIPNLCLAQGITTDDCKITEIITTSYGNPARIKVDNFNHQDQCYPGVLTDFTL